MVVGFLLLCYPCDHYFLDVDLHIELGTKYNDGPPSVKLGAQTKMKERNSWDQTHFPQAPEPPFGEMMMSSCSGGRFTGS